MYARRAARLSFRWKRNVVSARYARNAAPASRASARERDSRSGALEQPTNVKPRSPVAGKAAAPHSKMQQYRLRANVRIATVFKASPPKNNGIARPGFCVPPCKKLKLVLRLKIGAKRESENKKKRLEKSI